MVAVLGKIRVEEDVQLQRKQARGENNNNGMGIDNLKLYFQLVELYRCFDNFLDGKNNGTQKNTYGAYKSQPWPGTVPVDCGRIVYGSTDGQTS